METLREAHGWDGVLVVGKDACRYCAMVRELFSENGVEHRYFNLSEHCADQEAMRTFVRSLETGSQTVPQVFVNGVYVGGYTDCKDLLEDGLFPL